MAKIILKGSWIEIRSLNKEDKKNYLISISMLMVGAVFWGIHLTSVDSLMGPALDVNPNSSFYSIIRLLVLISWSISVPYFIKFLKTQDELMHRYYYYIGSWGGIGFLVFGMLMSLFGAYTDITFDFYAYFLAFALGTFVGGFLFDKKYLN